MPKAARTRVGAAERREQILTSAYELFVADGYDAVTMERVASAVGATKPIVYRRFASKDDLYAACAKRLVDAMLDAVRGAARAEGKPDLQLWAGIVAQLSFIAERRDEWRVYVRDAYLRGGLPGASLAEGRDRVIALLAELIGHASVAGGVPRPPEFELDALARGFQGSVEALARWWEDHPEQPLEAVALRAMNLAWHGFGGLLGGSIWTPPPGR